MAHIPPAALERFPHGFLRSFPLLALAGLLLALPAGSAPAAEPAVPADHAARMKQGLALFREQVRPLLTQHCLDCHGGKSTKADFNLATRESLLETGYVGKTAEESYFFAVVAHEEEPFMPLKQPKLSGEELAHLRRWIDLGAPYDRPLVEKAGAPPAAGVTEADRQFWSFQPLAPAHPPRVKNEAWCATPIDRFLLAKMEARGLAPNGPAERRVLIRRATFDLLGLPPTPEQVRDFLADDDPRAYEKLLDRLLDSPHYGERWARHWLDVARFAESHGYEQDYDRPHAYHYRDFLIRAFNDDLPYDTFARWQLAGDELAPENPLALTATGFLGGGPFPTQLTEMEFESARYDELDDMTATTGVAFLGLSVGCARCHDHKFDPIPARDYYRFAAAFTTAIRTEVELELTPEENPRRRAEWQARLAAAEAARDRYEQEELPAPFAAWLEKYDPAEPAAGLDGWTTLLGELRSSAGTRYEPLPDGSHLARGEAPPKEVLTFTAVARRPLRALRLEALTHESLPRRGPGRAPNGNFALGNVRVTARPVGGEGEPAEVKLEDPRATHEQNGGPLSIAASLDEDRVSGWAVDGRIGHDQAAVFTLPEPLHFEQGTELTVELVFEHPNTRHVMGRLRFSAGENPAAEPAVGGGGPPEEVLAALREARREGKGNEAAWNRARDWYKRLDPRWTALHAAVEKLRGEEPRPARTKAMITSEGLPHLPHHADGRGFPHFYPETHYLLRGDVHQKQEVVEPGYLQVLARDGKEAEHWRIEPPEESRTSFRRASLAHWLTDTEYGAGHLAARVMVNRLWQHHFGRGIVATPNDFGVQGERPTHPELLDWLAADFIAHGWRIKRLHKQMMLSSAYRQSSEADEARAAIDRENLLHWRRAPRRLEAEAIRDALLAVGGRLDPQLHGPGTLDPNMRRRSVYFFIKRSKLIPDMMLFDWPEHLVSIGRRATTTTATQALAFMNSPTGRAAAEGFAGRLSSLPDPEARLNHAYELAFARLPTAQERELAAAFLEEQSARHQAAGRKHAEQLALTDLCHALLSMNEFIYVD